MMVWFRLAAFWGAASLCFGCTPLPRVDQEDYCYADTAFVAEITKRNIGDVEIEYEFTVQTMYKGDPGSRTLVGFGEMNSCGPQKLEPNKEYLIYAKANDFDSNTLQIVAYKNMDDVKNKDIERMEKFYDCSCKINHDYDAFINMPSSRLPEPASNECNAPSDFCPNSGFCKKSIEGQCTWGNLGDCN
ncbi:uncharacterized protein LOC128163860 [Crassostrea angulata]|uniref:uncharacterized protein LOC128163860 n=1 Tax=Magallana angulata TaxID=2784310 RepID=UPI0022B0B26A|nr:uncharacterized protein LOC128163860 [Crassostrea angulata]